MIKRTPRTSSLCTPVRAVIQIVPGIPAGRIKYAGRSCRRLTSSMILPGAAGTIACPLPYFQRRASMSQGWIATDDGRRLHLGHVAGLDSVAVTIVENGLESESRLPVRQADALLAYFRMDVPRHEASYDGFDCYAFVSLLTDSVLKPEDPPFDFEEGALKAGDVVVVARGPELPHGIRHWALCVGEDVFISKFGRTGDGAQALVEATDGQAMLSLYDCDRMLIARRKADALPWDAARWPS